MRWKKGQCDSGLWKKEFENSQVNDKLNMFLLKRQQIKSILCFHLRVIPARFKWSFGI